MKNYRNIFMTIAVWVVVSAGVSAQTTEFTYQGDLQNGGVAASGTYDFEFLLFDAVTAGAQTGSTLTRTGVTVTNGIFSVKLDFGANFPGADRFLELHVRQNGGGAFTPLTPRQAVTSAPYSVKSLNADTATNSTQLGGVAANQYVTTTSGGTNFIQNTTSPQAASNFNISGVGNANIFNAATQYNIAGNRTLSIPGAGNLFAGVSSGNANSGANNSFFGTSSGLTNSTGANNAFFGSLSGPSNTVGSENTAVGFFADFASNNLTNAAAIGANAFVSQSNSLVLGSINGVNGATADTKVGIGTSAPNFTLEVSDPENLGLRVVVGSTGGTVASFGGLGTFEVDAPFNAGGRLRILESGNVGLGETNPTEKLHIGGGGNLRWANSHLSTQQGGSLEIGGTNSIAGTGTPFIDFHFLGATEDYNVRLINNVFGKLTIEAAQTETTGQLILGAFGNGGVVPVCFDLAATLSICSSSIRYKQNVNPFVSGLSLIKKLRPVSFNWKANNQADMGLVAEEVANVEPLLTTTNKNGEIEGVKYDRVGVVLVNAVQEQQTQIEAQQKQIDELNAIIKKQRADIDALKAFVCSQNPAESVCKPQN